MTKKANDFQILEGLTAIRTRPGTYIGDMSNVSNMIRETIDNAIDEYHKGVNDTVYIRIDPQPGKNIKVTVGDKSRTGFPLDEAEINGKPIGQTKMDASVSHLHAGSKFEKTSAMTGMNGCFIGATPVMVSVDKQVWTSVKIEDLAELSKQNKYFVMTSNGPAEMLRCFETKETTELVAIELSNEKFVNCTPDHKFMLKNGMYKQASALRHNDALQISRFASKAIRIEEVTPIHLVKPVKVYDITVADDVHNFALSAGVIVHNCGNKAVNALSDSFFMVTRVIDKNTKFPKQLKYNGEKWYYLEYHRGVKKTEGFVKNLKEFGLENLKDYTTLVQFIPDLTMFETANYSLPKGMDYVLKLAELSGKKLKIILNDEEYKSSIEDMKYKFDVTMPGLPGGKNTKVRIFGSFQCNGDILSKNNIGCVNSLAVHQGIHIDMVRKAYKMATREVLGDCGGMEDNGMDFTVFILANEVDFDSQSKTKLSRIPDFDKNDITLLKNELKSIIKSNLSEFEENFVKIQNLRAKRGELNKKQTLMNMLGDVTDTSTKGTRRADSFKPKRLKDAWTQNREKAELLVFEGNSAMNSAFKTRDPEFQAIFPMKGVCKNTVGLDILDVLKNDEMNDLFRSIGAGVEGFSNLDKIRYGKIIYCGDEDPDAKRIIALFIGAFGAHAKFLIEAGKLFVARTPFYIQNGKPLYMEEEDQLDKNKPFERIKGLGGLGKYFHDGITNAETRRLIQVTPEMLQEALEVLRSGPKKKELLLSTKIVSLEPWEETNGKEKVKR